MDAHNSSKQGLAQQRWVVCGERHVLSYIPINQYLSDLTIFCARTRRKSNFLRKIRTTFYVHALAKTLIPRGVEYKLFRKGTFATIALLSLSACAPPRSVIKFEQPQSAHNFVAVDLRKDDYPSFPLGEGNIYSCRYGIHFYEADEFSPAKGQIFADLLAEEKPGIASHRVKLTRFDVYRNWRLRLLSRAGGTIGGAVGNEITRNADAKNNSIATLPTFSVQEHPGNGRANNQENQIGCDGKGEGDTILRKLTVAVM